MAALDPVEVRVLAVDVLVDEVETRQVTTSAGDVVTCPVSTGRHVADPRRLIAAVTPLVAELGLRVDGDPQMLDEDFTAAWLLVRVPVAAA